MQEKLTPKRWKEAEKKVHEAEVLKRQASKASQKLSKSGEVPSRVEKKAAQRVKEGNEGAENLLADAPEKALVGMKVENLIQATRGNAALEEDKQKLLDEEVQILKQNDDLDGAALEALDEVREEMKGLEKRRETLLKSSPEAFYSIHLKELKEYKKELSEGRIAEMPYVKEHIDDIVAHLRGNRPVLVYGHLGSGKTELAMHIARNYVLQNRPDLDAKVEEGVNAWKKAHPTASQTELEQEHKAIDQAHRGAVVISGSKHTALAELYGHQVLAVDDESGGTVSDFKLGPIYRAMEEGRPVIVDEVNAIPHEVLISLNHILTRRVGDTVSVQQDTGKTVRIKDGFSVMMTGNLNQGQERYVDRQELDPAFLSRLYKVEYDYLPQKTDGSLKEEAGPDNQLFNLLVARVMDKNGNLEAPKDTLSKLWTLAKAARRTQDVFAGREVAGSQWQEAGGRSMPYFLKETVFSMRGLDAVVGQWKKDGYKRELDYYVWKEFIGQATDAQDRAYLYQQFKDREGFFKNWPASPTGNLGNVSTFSIKAPEHPPAAREFFGPRTLVEAVAGNGPERNEWPVVKERGSELDIETMEELESFKSELESEITNLEAEVGDFCAIEGKK